ncbi:dat-1 [Pristionchus pacificus]|uniref:Transporter n=1 Tax=Pristionchus pacificus TaxID=54126 RepID=A0A2A6CIG4_PRIPA|nr:dat-1 [Pristionchus pacificus]|eukprot:PDM77896.1 dat-1 [Pristionchus pacificus]
MDTAAQEQVMAVPPPPLPPDPLGVGSRYTLRIDGSIRLTVQDQSTPPSQMTTARRDEYGDEAEDDSSRLNGVKQRLVIEADDVKKPTGATNIGEDGRETWSSKVDFLLSVVGFAVDLGNIWRFPYLCFKNGGGVFLIPYTIMVLFAGVPLFYMELSLGQYYRKGAITTWGRVCPLFKGIGYCVIMIAFYTDFFYNVIIAWGFHFLYASFTTILPWASCNNSYNSPACYEPHYSGLDVSEKCAPPPTDNVTRISAAEEYFYKGFLGLHAAGDSGSHVARSLSDLGDVNWHIVIALAIVYLICYFSMWKGIGTSGKVVWFTALFPYVVLGVLFVRGITLPGSEMGIAYYLQPNVTMLWEPSVWQDAATQVFFSLGPGFGVLLAYSSYNNFHNNVYYDALLTSSINCATSFLSGFVIFSVLGYMSCKSGKRIEDVAQEGPGLVFVVYPEALATMPWAPGWSVLFFLMLITLGLDSSFGGSEAIITGLSDEYPIIKRNRERFLALLFGFYMIIGIFMCTNGGILIMEWIIVYGTTWGLLIAVFCEVMVIAFLYGVGQFTADVKEMLGFKPGIYWRSAWTVAAPVVLLLMILSSFIHYKPLVYQDYAYPTAANVLGIFFALSAASCIPIVGCYKLYNAQGATFSQKLERAMTPYRARPTQCEYTPIGGRNASNDIIL